MLFGFRFQPTPLVLPPRTVDQQPHVHVHVPDIGHDATFLHHPSVDRRFRRRWSLSILSSQVMAMDDDLRRTTPSSSKNRAVCAALLWPATEVTSEMLQIQLASNIPSRSYVAPPSY